jgi:hypothetical protein
VFCLQNAFMHRELQALLRHNTRHIAVVLRESSAALFIKTGRTLPHDKPAQHLHHLACCRESFPDAQTLCTCLARCMLFLYVCYAPEP